MSLADFIRANKKAVAVMAAVVIIVSLGSILGSGSRRPAVEMDRIVSIGAYSGEAVAIHLGEGKRVTMVMQDETNRDVYRKQSRAFLRALEAGGVQVVETEIVQSARPVGMTMDPMMEAISGPQFVEIASRHKDKDALVSLVGAPGVMEQEVWTWPKNVPPIVVGRHGGVSANVNGLLEAGVVTMGVFPRMTPPETDLEIKTHREHFDAYFEVITPVNSGTRP